MLLHYSLINCTFLFILPEYGNPGGMDAGGADFDSGECFSVCIVIEKVKRYTCFRKSQVIHAFNNAGDLY